MQDSSLTKTILLQTLYVRSVPLSVVFHLLSQLLLIYLLSSFCLIFPPLFSLLFFAPCLVCVIIIIYRYNTVVVCFVLKVRLAYIGRCDCSCGIQFVGPGFGYNAGVAQPSVLTD